MKKGKKVIAILILVILGSCAKEEDVNYDSDNPNNNGPITGSYWTDAASNFEKHIYGMINYDKKLVLASTSYDSGKWTYSSTYDGSSITKQYGDVNSNSAFSGFKIYDDELIAYGAHGYNTLYTWDIENKEWDPLQSLTNGNGAYTGANDFIKFNGSYIMGMSFAPHIKDNYNTMGDGFDDDVYTLVEHNGEVIAGGSFSNSGTTPTAGVAKWNGTSWDQLGDGLDGKVYDLLSFNGELYAAGTFTQSGTSPMRYLAKWDGTSWQNIGNVVGGYNGMRVLYGHGTELFVGGDFKEIDGIVSPNVIKWDGANWHELAGGAPDIVGNIEVYKNSLYITNQFLPNEFFLKLQ